MVESNKTENIDPAVIQIMAQYAKDLMENSQPTEEQKAKMVERAAKNESEE